MIITHRSANPSYTTDPVAASLRSAIAAPVAPRASAPSAAATTGNAPLDLAVLYPALFAQAPQPSVFTRSARALAFRLSVFGTAATMLVLLHR